MKGKREKLKKRMFAVKKRRGRKILAGKGKRKKGRKKLRAYEGQEIKKEGKKEGRITRKKRKEKMEELEINEGREERRKYIKKKLK